MSVYCSFYFRIGGTNSIVCFAYIRAIDNMLFVTEATVDGSDLVASHNKELKPYSVKLEAEWGVHAVVGCECEFFDFAIIKSDAFIQRGEISYRPVLRDKGPLLSFTSAHPTRLHISWPLGYVRRLYFRSSSIEYFRVARAHFVSRMIAHGIPNCIIDYVSDNSDYYMPHYLSCNVRRPKLLHSRFLVIPFHPLWSHSKLSSAVSAFANESQHRRLLQEAFRVTEPFPLAVSWKLMSQPLGQSLVEW